MRLASVLLASALRVRGVARVATEMAVGGATKNHTQNVVPIRVPYTTHEVCSPSEWTETEQMAATKCNHTERRLVPYLTIRGDNVARDHDRGKVKCDRSVR